MFLNDLILPCDFFSLQFYSFVELEYQMQVNFKNFRIRRQETPDRNSSEEATLTHKLDKMIGILADVAYKLQDQKTRMPQQLESLSYDDEQTISRLIAPQVTSDAGQTFIISGGINNTGMANDDFRAKLDPRDQILSFPFKFKVNLDSANAKQENSEKQHFLKSETYQQLCRQMEDFMVEMCETIISVSFNLLIEHKLSDNETKDYAAKNIILNTHALCFTVADALRKQKLLQSDEIPLFAQLIDDALRQILSNLSQYYPQAPPTGGSARIREVLLAVDRNQNEELDFLVRQNLRLEKQKDGNYVGYIMMVLNRVIQTCSEADPNDPSQRTLFEQFENFSESLFWLAQEDSYGSLIQEAYDIEIQRNETQAEAKRQAIRSFLNKNTSQQVALMKLMNVKEAEEKVEDRKSKKIEEMRQSLQFEIGRKLPSSLKCFTPKQMREGDFSAKNSSVLRLLTKWAETLEQIFESPERYTLNRSYPFKTLQHEFVYPSKELKTHLNKRILEQRSKVRILKEELEARNKHFQDVFLSTEGAKGKYIKRYTATRVIASKMNAMLVEFMLQYLSQLMHLLVEAGRYERTVYQMYQKKVKIDEINLINFRIGDLLRSKIHCSQSSFLRLLKTLYILDEAEGDREFGLVRIKNKLDSKDNNILINYLFRGQLQCQLQMSVQQPTGKQQHYYHFNHFLYELTRGKFGILSQCATIVSQHDPIVASSFQTYYEPKQDPKRAKKQVKRQQIEQKTLQNMFICQNCRKFKIAQSISFLKKAQYQSMICNQCIASSAIDMVLAENVLPQPSAKESYLSNDTYAAWIIKKLQQQRLLNVGNYQNLKTIRSKILFSVNKKKNELDYSLLFCDKHELEWVLIRLSEPLLVKKIQKDIVFEIEDITDKIKKRKKLPEFSYLANINDETLLRELFELQKYTCTSNITERLQWIQRECRLLYLKEDLTADLRNKNQILSYKESKARLATMQQLFDVEDNKFWLPGSLGHIEFLFAEGLEMKSIPTWLPKCFKLKLLNLTKNEFAQLNVETYSCFKKLEELRITENQIKSVQWKDNPCLARLFLSQNKITSINLESFSSLQELDLTQNQLTEISLINLPRLRILNLSSNKISKLDIEHLPSATLEKINLSSNSLAALQIKNYPKLVQINCSYNCLQMAKFQSVPKLVKIVSLYNHISTFELKDAPLLNSLNLSENNLTKLPMEQIPATLKYLYLRFNKLKTITVSNLPLLEELDLDRNQLTSIQLLQLPKLKKLDMSLNKMAEISLKSLPYLTNLNLSSNQLVKVELEQLPLLTQVNLQSNDLNNIGNLSQLLSLERLNFNTNKLEAKKIKQLPPNLKYLSLQQNRLRSLEYKQLPKTLEQLELDYNEFSALEWSALPQQLTTLILSKNQVRNCQFSQLPITLKNINLCNNSISKPNLRGIPPGLINLEMADNNIKECDLSHLPKSLKMLDLSDNHLQNVQLPDLPNLAYLRITGNQISEFSFGDIPHLEALLLSGNNLTSINISKLPKSVSELNFSKNKLVEVEIHDFPNLTKINLRLNQQMKKLSLSNIASLMQIRMPFDQDEPNQMEVHFKDINPSGRIAVEGGKLQLQQLKQKYPLTHLYDANLPQDLF